MAAGCDVSGAVLVELMTGLVLALPEPRKNEDTTTTTPAPINTMIATQTAARRTLVDAIAKDYLIKVS